MKVLDLYCKAGGAGEGFEQAGFTVFGIDAKPQPNYPYRFKQMDPLDVPLSVLARFDLVHAAPPCKRHSPSSGKRDRSGYVDYIDQIRKRLKIAGVPYSIENVPRAPLIDPVTLCGLSFGLRVKRHRIFETNFPVNPLECGDHSSKDWIIVYGKRGPQTRGVTIGKTAAGNSRIRRENLPIQEGLDAMGITNFMERHELSRVVPPAYTHYIATQFLKGR